MKRPNENPKFEAYGILLLSVLSLPALGFLLVKVRVLMDLAVGAALLAAAVMFTLGAVATIGVKLKARRGERERETRR